MAIVNRDEFFNNLASGTKWSAGVAFTRTNALPIDDKSVFSTLEAAQTYAQSATAYPGQVIAVVLSDKTDVYVINQTGELQSIASSTSPMIFKDSESEMLALTDIEAGQQVYRTDTNTIWIFKGGDASQLSNWVESAAQNDTVWYGTQNKVNFYALTETQYAGITPKDSNTLYFVSDIGKIYKGDVDVTTSISAVSTFPDVADAVRGKLYVDTTSIEAKFTTDGSNWITITPGYISDHANWAQGNDTKFATIGVIKQAISDAIKLAATWDKSTGTIKVGDGDGTVLTGVAHDVSYDSANLTITIPVYGGEDVVVNIPKDKFVTAGKYYEDYPEENPTHHKVIVLTIDNQAEPVIIPAESLVNIYTADNSGKNIVVSISDDNKVSAQAVIDPVAGNALTSSENGLKVQIIDGSAEDAGKLVVVDSTGKALAVGSIQPANILTKISGTENDIVSLAADGSIKDSGAKIGGATLSDAPDSTTVATEAAVADAIAWRALQ